jgi:hypothetical protein
VDHTFDGIDHRLYRMQIVRSSEKPFYKQFNRHSKQELHFAPELNMLHKIPPDTLVAEENLGLNDNIHLLIYTQPKTGHQALQEELEKRQMA